MFVIDDAISAVAEVIGKFIPDATQAAQAQAEIKMELLKQQEAAMTSQTDTNKIEAANASMFVAGWRPAAGWLCVSTMGLKWLLYPLATWWLEIFHIVVPAFPEVTNNDSQWLLYTLLGVGGLRTADKLGGVDTTKVGGIMGSVAGVVQSVVGKKK